MIAYKQLIDKKSVGISAVDICQNFHFVCDGISEVEIVTCNNHYGEPTTVICLKHSDIYYKGEHLSTQKVCT